MIIIQSYRKRSAQSMYDKGVMHSFLNPINPNSPSEMRVLRVWTDHFEQADDPYLVIKVKRICQDYVERDNAELWVEDFLKN